MWQTCTVALFGLTTATASAQTADGVVRDELSGTVISGASVSLTTATDSILDRTFSDAGGRFVMTIPAPGSYRLRVSLIGYALFSSDVFDVGSGEGVSADILLSVDAVELAPMEVVTESRVRSLDRVGFYRRLEKGFGHFLNREEIAALHPHKLSDIFRRLPGIQVVNAGNNRGQDLIMSGARTMFLRLGSDETCYPSISIDGLVVRPGGLQPNYDSPNRPKEVGKWSGLLHPNDVEAVEIYPRAAGLPPQVGGTISPCGAVLIWTR